MAQVSREGFEQNRTYNYVKHPPEELDAGRHIGKESTTSLDSIFDSIHGGVGGMDPMMSFIAALILCIFFGAIVAMARNFFLKLLLCCIFIGIAFNLFSTSFAVFATGSSLGMLFGHPDGDSPNFGAGFFLATTVIGVVLMVAGLIGCIRNVFF